MEQGSGSYDNTRRQHVQAWGRPALAHHAGEALQACADPFPKKTHLKHKHSGSAGDLILAPIPNKLPDWLCVHEAHEGAGVQAELVRSCRFRPPYSCNCRWGWFTCTRGSHSMHNISLADGSSDIKPQRDPGAWLRYTQCWPVIIIGEGWVEKKEIRRQQMCVRQTDRQTSWKVLLLMWL